MSIRGLISTRCSLRSRARRLPPGCPMIRSRLCLSLLLAFALTLAIASSSYAAVIADVADPVQDNGASFNAAPTDVTRVQIGWDGRTLAVSVTYAAPSFRSLDLLLSDSALDEDEDEYDATCDSDAADSI